LNRDESSSGTATLMQVLFHFTVFFNVSFYFPLHTLGNVNLEVYITLEEYSMSRMQLGDGI